MATVIITKGKEVFTIKFKRTFYIEEDLDGQIFWNADGAKPGTMLVWVQLADTDPRIAFVLPTWKVTLNGVDLEQKFYEDMNNLQGKEIRLRYGELSFTFQF